MHPTNGESMLLSVHQEEPDKSDESQEQTSNVSEDELDMILATMGTTSLKDSEMALLQDDVEQDEFTEEEKGKIEKKPRPENAAKRAVKKFFNKLRNAKK